VFFFQVVYRSIKAVQVSVPKEWIVYNIPLSPSMLEGVVVSFSGKVKPLYKQV
jgi:hypothetical protein